MTTNSPYTGDFCQLIQEGSRRSAEEIVPLVLELLHPKSIIDVGCGVGTWLSVFKEFGVEDILGIDGDCVDKKMLQIPEEQFLSFDLSKPFRIDRQFDLVVSLEVSEHIPCNSAETFVDSLTRLGKVILFSAAIPFQGGENHINEQWPDYWDQYFRKREYLAVDCIRRRIWKNDSVEFWYAQNMLVFARWDYLENHHLLKKEFENIGTSQLSVVHPKKYLEVLEKCSAEAKAAKWYAAAADPRNMSLRKVLSVLPIVAANGLKRTIVNFFRTP